MSRARAAERLRQERVSFDVRKTQSCWWFGLRFATGLALLAIAIAMFVIAAVILFNPARYSPAIVNGSGVAMMLDLVAIAGAGFASLLRPASQPDLEPSTISDND